MTPLDAAVVLGSTQPETVAAGPATGTTTESASGGPADGDPADTSGISIVRRRSGGGAVLVTPGDCVWVDVIVGRGDPLWDDDVNRASWWLGRAWADALASLGVGPAQVVQRFEPGPWGRLVCFAGRGPGEVTVGGAKVVGVTQRRTRTTARFQTLLYRRWAPETLLKRLVVPSHRVEELRGALARAARPVAARPEHLHAALLAAMPQ